MIRRLAILLLFASAPSAWPLEIIGPEVTPVYRMARFKAKANADQSVSWSVVPRGTADLQQVGNDILFVGPPGQYELELLAVGPSGDATRPFAIERVYRTVSIGNSAPGPVPPGPNPEPPDPAPEKPIPPGRFGLAQKCKTWAGKLPPDARKIAPQIANSFRAMAEKIAHCNDDNITIPAVEIEAETRKLNQAVLSLAKVDWSPVFGPLAEELTKLRLETMGKEMNGAYRDAWTEIADGFNAAKKK